jgi:PhnB protein
MSDQPTVPMLAPHLVCDDAAGAIDYYKQAFGAEELIRIPGPDGKLMHASVSINGSMVMLVDANEQCGMLSPRRLGGTPVTIHLNVTDVDAVVARAEAAGGTIKMPVEDQFWGDRYGVIEDPSGHVWSIATPIRQQKMTETELREAAQKVMA